MCGASLDQEEGVLEAEPRQRPLWPFLIAVVAVSLLVLAVGGLLLRPFIFPPAATATPTSSPTVTPTPTSTPTPTLSPSATPTTMPPQPRAHQVQEGETLLSIAQQYDATSDEILALNPGISPDLLQVGQVLLVPAATPTPGPTGAEPAGPTPTTPGDIHIHVVAPGETLLSIAQEYSVTVALLRAANPEIPAGSDVIRVNQSLIIPLGTPMPTPTPTPDPNATPTPLPPYPPPPLLSPPDGSVFGGPDAAISLQWAAVAILRPNEWYEVHVFRPGTEPLVERTRATVYRIPQEAYPPPGSRVRTFRWWVRVVRRAPGEGIYKQSSEQGPVYAFLWLEAPPTPTPSPSPTP
jgi:LysM repeat protein